MLKNWQEKQKSTLFLKLFYSSFNMDMFTNFRNKFKSFISKVGITKNDVKDVIKELQKSLIAADVDVKLTLDLTRKIEEKINKQEDSNLTLKQKTIKAIYESLEEILGKPYEIKLKKQVIMLIGLYGSGKTTTAGKLALFFKNKGLSVALLSLDDERPAAGEQLKQIAEKVKANFYDSNKKELVKNRKEDVLIIDTPGKNAVDESLLEKLRKQYEEFKPDEVFIVLQADIGKVAIEQVKGFKKAIPINAAIITKFDGSGKAGGCISALSREGINIAFLGTGEKMDALISYSTKDLIIKIFGMPNLEWLRETLQKIDERVEDSEETFNLETFYKQLKMFNQSSFQNLVTNLGFYDMPREILLEGEKKIKKYEAMINSMTKEERKNPETVKKTQSRIKRIAKGSGLTEEEVVKLLNDYFKAEKAVKKLMSNKQMLKMLSKKFNFFG